MKSDKSYCQWVLDCLKSERSYPYHFVRTILSVPLSPLPFCPRTISISYAQLSLSGASILGWESRPPDFGQEGRGGRRGHGRVMKYYYMLSCTGSMFESGDF